MLYYKYVLIEMYMYMHAMTFLLFIGFRLMTTWCGFGNSLNHRYNSWFELPEQELQTVTLRSKVLPWCVITIYFFVFLYHPFHSNSLFYVMLQNYTANLRIFLFHIPDTHTVFTAGGWAVPLPELPCPWPEAEGPGWPVWDPSIDRQQDHSDLE